MRDLSTAKRSYGKPGRHPLYSPNGNPTDYIHIRIVCMKGWCPGQDWTCNSFRGANVASVCVCVLLFQSLHAPNIGGVEVLPREWHPPPRFTTGLRVTGQPGQFGAGEAGRLWVRCTTAKWKGLHWHQRWVKGRNINYHYIIIILWKERFLELYW